jgi:hypothetical protein
MSDAEIIREFLRREHRWLSLLNELRVYHQTQMGKITTASEWVGGNERGRFSWLGYYWHREMFWFGFGLNDDRWQPLIEADNRSKYSDAWGNLGAQLAGTWEVVSAGGSYRRLWAPPEIAEDSTVQLHWFRERSRELHEYVINP